MTEEQLLAELDGMGLAVEYRPLAGTMRGYYSPHAGLVVVRPGMTMPQRRSTLAHELIHARRCDDGPQSLSIERRIDERAAQLLIAPQDYRLAEYCHGPHRTILANELDVTPTIIEAYQRALTTR